jgi:hypothetical protein
MEKPKNKQTKTKQINKQTNKQKQTKKRFAQLHHKLLLFYWPCLPKQGFCVQIHYRV